MNLPEGWPTEEMIAEVEGLEYDFTPGGSETVTGYVSEEMAREIFEKMYAAAPTPAAQARIELPYFDSGSLPDFIDGDAELWQDAIRNLLEVAHEHYQEQVDDLLTPSAQEDEPVAWMTDYICDGQKRRGIFGHNAIGDYREIDPGATATPLYIRPADDKLRVAIGGHLAIAHRDGGQHEEAVGTEQAISEATKVIIELRKAAEELLSAYDDECGDITGKIGADFENLRAALDGKS